MALDEFAATLAFRARALSLVVATTGSTTLSATATGYARTVGSFITDGFLVGMELVPSGFSVNTPRVITAVSALAVTVDGAPAVQAAAGARSLTVGLPSVRAWENVAVNPVPGRPYVDEEFVPGESWLETFPAQGGFHVDTCFYVLKIYGLPGIGIGMLRKTTNALRALFAPGTTVTVVGADTVRVRGDTATQTSQILQYEGWAVVSLKIPWRAWTTNTVAA